MFIYSVGIEGAHLKNESLFQISNNIVLSPLSSPISTWLHFGRFIPLMYTMLCSIMRVSLIYFLKTFLQFLDDCTEKLKLESGARLLFDWEGKEIKSFSDGQFALFIYDQAIFFFRRKRSLHNHNMNINELRAKLNNLETRT